MKHLISYKYRLYPTIEQEVLLSKHFGCCRFIYNHFLNSRIENYKVNKKSSNYENDANTLPTLKKTYEWLKEVGSQSIQYSIRCLQNAYDNFFSRVKKKVKGKKGFPRFKSKNNKQSFRIPDYLSIKVLDNKVTLPKFLEGIKVVIHRELQGKIRFATVSKNKAGQYHISITAERCIEQLPLNDNKIGIDLNVMAFVDSNKVYHQNPLPELSFRQQLKLLSKRVSRSVKGSKNRIKARQKLSKLKLYCHNIREDFQHKLSKKLIDENQVICIEDLSVASMMETNDEKPKWKQRKLHRNLGDTGFYAFVAKLMYKALWYGREIVKVSRWFPSSQLCSHCGWQNKELGEEKEWQCWNCFTIHDRDENAATNILVEGLRKQTCGMQGLAYCPDVRPKMKLGLLVG